MKTYFNQSHSIFKWFYIIFVIISLIFCLVLAPLFLHLKNIFKELQLEKYTHQLTTTINQLENTVNGFSNVAQSLTEDSRFVTFRYIPEKTDYVNTPINIQNQLRNSFRSLIIPLELVSDAVLQLNKNIAVTTKFIFFERTSSYYPDFFCVDDLTYEEWTQLLSENKSGFFSSAHRITINSKKEYNALIYSLKWTDSSYIYACLDIANIKKLLITESEGHYLTIASLDGTILYSNLPETESSFYTISKETASGGLVISLHISKNIFNLKMKPLNFFLVFYLATYLFLLILITLLGTHISTRPILSIFHLLYSSKHILSTDHKTEIAKHSNVLPSSRFLPSSFAYMADCIRKADSALEYYQSTFQTQQKILQASFLEKAINGQLTAKKDIQLFRSYFPNFPDSSCLLLLLLRTTPVNDDTLYENPLLLLQTFLQSELPNAYLQQYNDSEILLLISEEDFDSYCKTLNSVIQNIHEQEPAYEIRCLASNFFQHPESLPAAYRQIQDIIDTATALPPYVCKASAFQNAQMPFFTMRDMQTLYTAITYGNREIAVNTLREYSEVTNPPQVTTMNRHTYEMICAVLNCIKLEHATLLMDLHIPAYLAYDSLHTGEVTPASNILYTQMEELICRFCDLIHDSLQPEGIPLARDIIQYIDAHYTEYDLCIATLEIQFQCSATKIRKLFKNATNVQITSYIEQKRMTLAKELLAQNQKNVAEIASECGFANSNTFYKAYKRFYGHAPTLQIK